VIALAAPEQLPAIIALLERSSLPADDLPSDAVAFVTAVDERGNLVGTAALERCDAAYLLRGVAVAVQSQGSGIGRLLVADALHRAAGTPVYLFTTDAAGYFQRRGFRACERDALPDSIRSHPQATHLCPSTATAMRFAP